VRSLNPWSNNSVMEITYPHCLFAVLGKKFRHFPCCGSAIKACSKFLRVKISSFVPEALRSVYCHTHNGVLTPDFDLCAPTAFLSEDKS